VQYAITKVSKENSYRVMYVNNKFLSLVLVPLDNKTEGVEPYYLVQEYLKANSYVLDSYLAVKKIDSVIRPLKLSIDSILKVKMIIDSLNSDSYKEFQKYPIESYRLFSGFNSDRIYIVSYTYFGNFCRKYKSYSPNRLTNLLIVNDNDSILLLKKFESR
jgi:hypothetical protein